MKTKSLLKLFLSAITLLSIQSTQAYTYFWRGGSSDWETYSNWSTDPITLVNINSVIPTTGDSVIFDAISFPGGGEIVTVSGSNILCEMIDFSGLDPQIYITLPTLQINNGAILKSTSQNIFSSNIRLDINGVFLIGGDDYVGLSMGVNFYNAVLISTTNTGVLRFECSLSPGSKFDLQSDINFVDGVVNITRGEFNVNPNTIKCKGLDLKNNASGLIYFYSLSGATIECSGDVILDNSIGLTLNFDVENATIILNSKDATDHYFKCDGCNYSASSLVVKKGSYYLAYLTAGGNDMIFNNITLEDSTQTHFNNNLKLKYNTISTTATVQNTANTIFEGNTLAIKAGLEDMDGGFNCLYNVTMKNWDVTTGQVNVSSPGWTAADNAGNFKTPFKGLVKDAFSGGVVTAGNVKLFKEVAAYGQLQLADSVDISPVGEYELNPGNYIDGGTYRLWASSPGLLDGYYTKTLTLQDSSAFLWSDAYQFTGLGCGGSIDATINLNTPLVASGSGVIAGAVNEGVGYGMKIIDPGNNILTPGQPVKGVKVGLGKNPPGSVASIAVTDNTGKYSFGNLPPGNYTVYVDIEGLDLISTYTLTITGSDSLLNRDFIADSATVYANNIFTGFNNLNKQQPGLTLYPNPSSNTIYINYESTVGEHLNIEIENTLGQSLYFYTETITQFGNQTHALDLNKIGIPTGTFFIKTNINNKQFVNKIVKN